MWNNELYFITQIFDHVANQQYDVFSQLELTSCFSHSINGTIPKPNLAQMTFLGKAMIGYVCRGNLMSPNRSSPFYLSNPPTSGSMNKLALSMSRGATLTARPLASLFASTFLLRIKPLPGSSGSLTTTRRTLRSIHCLPLFSPSAMPSERIGFGVKELNSDLITKYKERNAFVKGGERLV